MSKRDTPKLKWDDDNLPAIRELIASDGTTEEKAARAGVSQQTISRWGIKLRELDQRETQDKPASPSPDASRRAYDAAQVSTPRPTTGAQGEGGAASIASAKLTPAFVETMTTTLISSAVRVTAAVRRVPQDAVTPLAEFDRAERAMLRENAELAIPYLEQGGALSPAAGAALYGLIVLTVMVPRVAGVGAVKRQMEDAERARWSGDDPPEDEREVLQDDAVRQRGSGASPPLAPKPRGGAPESRDSARTEPPLADARLPRARDEHDDDDDDDEIDEVDDVLNELLS